MVAYSIIVFVVYFVFGITWYSWPKESGCYIFGGMMLSMAVIFILTLIYGTMSMASVCIPLMLVSMWLGNMLDPKR